MIKHNGEILADAYVGGMKGKECDVAFFPNGIEVKDGDEIHITNEVEEIVAFE